MANYKELGFDLYVEKSIPQEYLDYGIDNEGVAMLPSSASGGSGITNITSSNSGGILKDTALNFDKLNIETLSINQSIRGGANGYNDGTGWWLGHDGNDYRFFIGNSSGNKLTWDGSTLSIAGSLTATTGTIGGFTIGAMTISATNLTLTSGAANTANITVGTGATAGGINSANAGGDIVFWAGATFANRATAPFRVNASGEITHTTNTLLGNYTVSTGGNIRSGQTAYDTGTGYFLEYNGGTPRFSIGIGGSTTANLTWDGTTLTVNGRTFTSDPIFGDGNDGAVIIAGDTILTRDMFYTTLVVNAGVVLNAGSFKIAAATSITVNGTISRENVNIGGPGGNGVSLGAGDPVGGAGGVAAGANAALAAGSLGGAVLAAASGAGIAGGSGTPASGNNAGAGLAGAAGTNVSNSIGSNGSAGIAGLVGGTGGAANGGVGGNGGSASPTSVGGTATAALAGVRSYGNAAIMFDTGGGTLYRPSASGGGQGGSNGGGGGGGNTIDNGGGGGGGGAGGGDGNPGGMVWISSPIITVAAAGVIGARGTTGGVGGNGGNGANMSGLANRGGGGGGSGGNGGKGGSGGVIVLIYQTLTNNGTISAAGGAGGAGGAAGTGGAGGGGTGLAGSNGSTGAAGATGANGIVYQFQRI